MANIIALDIVNTQYAYLLTLFKIVFVMWRTTDIDPFYCWRDRLNMYLPILLTYIVHIVHAKKQNEKYDK